MNMLTLKIIYHFFKRYKRSSEAPTIFFLLGACVSLSAVVYGLIMVIPLIT